MIRLGLDPSTAFTDNATWSVFSKLAAENESVRRQILRPHEDEFTEGVEVAEVRARLDRALDALTQIEIFLQCGGHDVAHETPLPQAESLLALAGCDSFLRYVNSYLYFSVRMLLRRYFDPDAVVYRAVDGFWINREPWWLAVPPAVSNDHADKASMLVEATNDSGDVRAALAFLDGTVPKALLPFRKHGSLGQTLELWIRGLQPELAGTEIGTHLEQIVRGLTEWSKRQATFYLQFAPEVEDKTHPLQSRPKDGWRCDSPVIARVALGDLYWIAGLLRTDVTASAQVTNRTVSWLGLLRFRAALYGSPMEQQDLQATEEILREVFGACCDLVQNAYELAATEQQRLSQPMTGQRSTTDRVDSGAESWRTVFDRELDEVSTQRDYREYGSGKQRGGEASAAAKGWSRHLYTGDTVPDLIGLAFSGGGIRSATFNLGVLQGLQELDLLRQVDYLSTVSGGGFTGSWLMGNVRRSTYWLGRLTPWDDSISHLRKFSNYLAPRTGILSMDTWSLGALWLRNTLLIQLTALAWMLVLFCGVYLLRLLFVALAAAETAVGANGIAGVGTGAALLFLGSRLVLPVLAAVVVAEVVANLRGSEAGALLDRVSPRRKHSETVPGQPYNLLQRGSILALAVLPAWLGAAVLATQEFATAWRTQCATALPMPHLGANAGATCAAAGAEPHFSKLFLSPLTNPVGEYKTSLLLLFTFLGLFLLSRVSLLRSKNREANDLGERVGAAAGIAALCTVLVQVCLSAILLVLELQARQLHSLDRVATLTVTWGPAATLGTYSLAILLMTGLAGRASDSAQREWWTRYGAWVLGCAVAGFAVPAVVFGSPWFLHWLHHTKWIKWGAVGGWVLTSLGGLLAGKSSRTAGEGATRTPSLQMLANVGGALFLLGAAMGTAELLYLYLRAQVGPVYRLGVLGVEALAGDGLLLGTLVVLLGCALIFSWRFDLNVFGLSELYRNRLVRCYLGATRWQAGERRPGSFTEFDFNDDLKLSSLSGPDFRGPFPIINCSLNLAGSADLALHTRHSASFTLTPVFCGAAREHVGYRPTATFAGGLLLGQAVAVSGAAASPNMGYNTSPLVALLLTLFNVRLGWWFPNPGARQTPRNARHWLAYLRKRPGADEDRAGDAGPGGLRYLMAELLGLASERRAYVNVTDGGHFENLGIYELVRRRSQLIIACDAECDETMTFTGLANAIRLCATDFGAHIELDLSSLRRGDNGLSRAHSAVGLIRYSNGSVGRILYLKASLTGDEDATIAQYATGHPTFPHETTANQFFKEEQFESYRRLGHHAVRSAMRNVATRESLIRAAERLIDTVTPAASTAEKFLQHTAALQRMWQHFRADHPRQLQRDGFLMELMGHAPQPFAPAVVDADVTALAMEALQLMEDIFIDLRLDDFWEHPDHRGWALLFMGWARSPRFRAVWSANHRTFGIRFEHFCATRLGLVKDDPVLRVSPLTRD